MPTINEERKDDFDFTAAAEPDFAQLLGLDANGQDVFTFGTSNAEQGPAICPSHQPIA